MTGSSEPPPPTTDPSAEPPAPPEMGGTFQHVFGGEIPVAERAWRRGDEAGEGPAAVLPEAFTWAIETLPAALRDIQAEVRRATDLATDALAAQAQAPVNAETSGDSAPRPFDPLPTALRELREEVREAVDRATETLAATRQGMDALPAIIGTVRDEFERLTAQLTEALTGANLEAARAFSLVAREVRTLGDRQAVLREEVRLLGRRFEEMERMRRRQSLPRSSSPARRQPPAAAPD